MLAFDVSAFPLHHTNKKERITDEIEIMGRPTLAEILAAGEWPSTAFQAWFVRCALYLVD